MPPKGLQACATGYMMTPVSFSHVAQIVRLECPIYHPITVDTKSDNNSGRQARDSTYDDVYSRQILGYPYTKAADNGWTVTDLLHSKQCQPYFTILPSSISSELYVRADLEELVGSSITSSTQWALYYAHTVKVHPDDPAFLVECARLKVTVPCQMRTEPSAFAAPEVNCQPRVTSFLSLYSALCYKAFVLDVAIRCSHHIHWLPHRNGTPCAMLNVVQHLLTLMYLLDMQQHFRDAQIALVFQYKTNMLL